LCLRRKEREIFTHTPFLHGCARATCALKLNFVPSPWSGLEIRWGTFNFRVVINC
jgi:hypothetical protein